MTVRYLVVDLEATCCDQKSIPRDQMEIIEIGAVLVDGSSLKILSEFQSFVRPARTSPLTAFCTRLTSITQAQVDNAPGFAEVLARLQSFRGDSEATFASWGDYDWNQLRQDAAFHRVPLQLGGRHLNLKRAFGEHAGDRKGPGLGLALRRVGLTFEGTPHRGIDDARNIARLLPWSLGLRAVPAEGSRAGARRS